MENGLNSLALMAVGVSLNSGKVESGGSAVITELGRSLKKLEYFEPLAREKYCERAFEGRKWAMFPGDCGHVRLSRDHGGVSRQRGRQKKCIVRIESG